MQDLRFIPRSNRIEVHLFAILLASAPLMLGCDPCEDGSNGFLSLGIGYSDGESGATMKPEFGEVWYQPFDETMVVSAVYGADDPRPSRDLFEFHEVTETGPVKLEARIESCSSDAEKSGSCAIDRNSACGFQAMDWYPEFEFDLEREYAVVLRPDEGNGLDFNVRGDAEQFAGDEGWVIPIVVAEDVTITTR